MAPKKAKTMKRDQKHGKNGKKEGLSGSSFFTWFMVIALLGVWTSVAVVWFDLVDYEEFLAKAKDFRYNLSEALQGKLGDYDADGDGDFDVDDAKVLLGLKERFVSKKTSDDLDETDSIQSDLSDADLQDTLDAMQDSPPLDDDIFDLEDALDDHETQYDTVSEFTLEDAVVPSVHASITTEPEEPVIEEQVVDDVIEDVWEQEPTADHDDGDDDDDNDDVEEATLTFEDKQAEYQEPEDEQEVEETETEFLNAPNTETEEPVHVEDVEYKAAPLAVEEPAPVAGKEPEAELAKEEEEPQDEHLENNQEPEVLEEKYDYHEESVLTGEEDLVNEPAEDETSYEDVNEYSPHIELEEEEPAELSDDPDGETAPEETEETSETDEDSIEGTEEFVIDSDEIHAHEHVQVQQNEIPENPVVDNRPSERVEGQDRHTLGGQQGEHADT